MGQGDRPRALGTGTKSSQPVLLPTPKAKFFEAISTRSAARSSVGLIEVTPRRPAGLARDLRQSTAIFGPSWASTGQGVEIGAGFAPPHSRARKSDDDRMATTASPCSS